MFNKPLQDMAPNPFAFKGILFVLLTSCRLNKRNEAWGVPQCVLTLASKRQETSEACLMSPQEIMLDLCIVLPSSSSSAACGLSPECLMS